LKNVASAFSNWVAAGQHVVGELRGLGHRDVDHDESVERGDRLAHALESASECAGLAASTIIAR
jgi:hypothetical protein